MKYFFLILPKYNNKQLSNNSATIQQLQHWYGKWNSKKFVYIHEMGKQIKSSFLI